MLLIRRIFLLLGLIACVQLQAQPQQAADSLSISSSFVTSISERAGKLEARLDKQSQKVLHKFEKQETRILRKLYRKDSLKAKAYEQSMREHYSSLKSRLSSPQSLQQYIPSLDTITSSLNFLNQAPGFLKGDAGAKVKDAMGKIDGLKSQLGQAEQIKQFLKDRKAYVRQQVESLGFVKELKQLNKQAYYYAEQLAGYKEFTVEANQTLNATVMEKADTYYGKPGANTLHEVTEAYQGALIAQKTGVSTGPATAADEANPSSVYSRAHSSATPQSGTISAKVNGTKADIVVDDGKKGPLIIQTIY